MSSEREDEIQSLSGSDAARDSARESGEEAAYIVDEASKRLTSGERWTVIVLSIVYGAFYFCRTNIGAAVPGLKSSFDQGGLGLSSEFVGSIQGTNKVAYGVGQLFNGQLSERFSPRLLLAVGMLGSAAMNVAFGMATSAATLPLLWAANGYFQSLGWTPCVRVAGNWVLPERRGKAIGIMGLGYQVSTGLVFLVSGFAASQFGWRGALYVPAVILAATAVFMLLFVKDRPGEDYLSDRRATRAKPAHPLWNTIWLTFTNPALWLLGISLGALNACRWGFLDWGIAHLTEVQAKEGLEASPDVFKSAMQFVVLPLGAVPSVYFTGLVTDRYFRGRRAPVICMLMLTLAGLTLVYNRVAAISVPATVALLVPIGLCLFGPQVLLVGTAPSDLARKGTAAAAAGFVNFMGYMGAASGDILTGYVKERYGWKTTILVWAAWAVVSALAAACLWNAGPRHDTETILETK